MKKKPNRPRSQRKDTSAAWTAAIRVFTRRPILRSTQELILVSSPSYIDYFSFCSTLFAALQRACIAKFSIGREPTPGTQTCLDPRHVSLLGERITSSAKRDMNFLYILMGSRAGNESLVFIKSTPKPKCEDYGRIKLEVR